MWINLAVLLTGLLLLLGIASSKFSARLGVPVLVLFLSVEMVAGSEGLGGIPFVNYPLANSVGSVALALILFDGVLRTHLHGLGAAGMEASPSAVYGWSVGYLIAHRPGCSSCQSCRGFCWAASLAPEMPQRCFRCCELAA